MERRLTYANAIREATDQAMGQDPSVIIFGLGVDDCKGVNGTTTGLLAKFGAERVFDTPLSEDAMTGMAIGASFGGLRPIHVHIRMDFLLLAMNQLVNIAAKARYMFGGAVSVPIVVRSVIGKSWGQGAQHSQALQSIFMHIPGLRVVAPTTPYDAKGCLLTAIQDNDPVIFVEHRLLHLQSGPVPEEPYTVPFGEARVLARGDDITLVGISYMAAECLRAGRCLAAAGIDAEIIDPVSLAPLDVKTIVCSVRKTRRLLVVDNAWPSCGAGSEIISRVIEETQGEVSVHVRRMGFEPVTCPTAKNLQDIFYPDARRIASTAHSMLHGGVSSWTPDTELLEQAVEFKGPF